MTFPDVHSMLDATILVAWLQTEKQREKKKGLLVGVGKNKLLFET